VELKQEAGKASTVVIIDTINLDTGYLLATDVEHGMRYELHPDGTQQLTRTKIVCSTLTCVCMGLMTPHMTH
jgi:hypothetical protein